MKDSELRPTTSCGSRGNRSPYGWDSPPPAAHISYRPEMVGMRFGWVKIISSEKRWNAAMNHCRVLTRCTGCGSVQWQDLGNLRRGKSRGCQSCLQPRSVPIWLEKRLSAARQRCSNPNDKEYRNYGARGIRFCFPSVLDAGLHVLDALGLPEKKLEIDRIDTNGDYAPGNLRFVPHPVNCTNQRRNVLSEFRQEHWPYSRSAVIRKLSGGMSREQIIQDAEDAVAEKRKNWRLISARLEFMTYSMPDRITVSRYRGSSCTTAGTAAAPGR